MYIEGLGRQEAENAERQRFERALTDQILNLDAELKHMRDESANHVPESVAHELEAAKLKIKELTVRNH
jgi:hypothetical protein